jgi:diacylglycerol kinase family enzyme
VLARSLGLPRDPVDATAAVLDALRSGRRRRISLGRADDRWFTFCAGLGFDAEVVARVERLRRAGLRATGGRYVRAAVREYLFTARRRSAPLTVKRPDGTDLAGVHIALVTNTAPWTYIGDRTVDPSPAASFDAGLDLYALTGLGLPSTLAQVRRVLAGRTLPPKGRHVVAAHDLDGLVLRADRPLAFQLDGDYLGDRTEVRLTAARGALAVLG